MCVDQSVFVERHAARALLSALAHDWGRLCKRPARSMTPDSGMAPELGLWPVQYGIPASQPCLSPEQSSTLEHQEEGGAMLRNAVKRRSGDAPSERPLLGKRISIASGSKATQPPPRRCLDTGALSGVTVTVLSVAASR
jgi:hypothetical protein